MEKRVSAPLLTRVKSWQLIGLGISGWCALYSVALITWGASSAKIGNTQGGCFAATMTLASYEARRCKRKTPAPADPLQWASSISIEHVNQAIAQTMQQREFRVERCHDLENELGFGVRAVNTGRAVVFETSRWKEPVIDAVHAQTTDANRRRVYAALAVIVGVGTPDDGAKTFAKTHPVTFLGGKELKDMLQPEEKKPDTAGPKKPLFATVFKLVPRLIQQCRPAKLSTRRRKPKARQNWLV